MGIDPGTQYMGYGFIHHQNRQLRVLTCGVINLKKLENQALKLKKISEETLKLIEQYQPDEMALESPFLGKNVQVALKLGRAQGVAMAAALLKEIPIHEYAPRKIKQSVTGNGNASKVQVAAMLSSILKISTETYPVDATDALGVALCHYFQSGVQPQRHAGWGSFVKENPDRVQKKD